MAGKKQKKTDSREDRVSPPEGWGHKKYANRLIRCIDPAILRYLIGLDKSFPGRIHLHPVVHHKVCNFLLPCFFVDFIGFYKKLDLFIICYFLHKNTNCLNNSCVCNNFW